MEKEENKELIWNVYCEGFNNDKIKVRNVFNLSGYFIEKLSKIKKKNLNFNDFSKEVESALMYCYWGKCEYEVVLHSFIKSPKNPVELKIDVYAQVMMNFEHFISYLWANKELIKES